MIARRTLREFWEAHPESEQQLRAWYNTVKQSEWKTPADVKTTYRHASLVANDRVVFNIKGNQYRLIVRIDYEFGVVFIRFIGTHREYDRVDAVTV